VTILQMSFEEWCIKVHLSIWNGNPWVQDPADGKRYNVQKSSKQGIRFVEWQAEGFKYKVIEQNKFKVASAPNSQTGEIYSEWALRVQKGDIISWLLIDGKWAARMENRNLFEWLGGFRPKAAALAGDNDLPPPTAVQRAKALAERLYQECFVGVSQMKRFVENVRREAQALLKGERLLQEWKAAQIRAVQEYRSRIASVEIGQEQVLRSLDEEYNAKWQRLSNFARLECSRVIMRITPQKAKERLRKVRARYARDRQMRRQAKRFPIGIAGIAPAPLYSSERLSQVRYKEELEQSSDEASEECEDNPAQGVRAKGEGLALQP
jgi:hypothetical protein